jgi:hypothetical protein
MDTINPHFSAVKEFECPATADTIDQLPPHDAEAEKGALGCALLSPDKLPEIISALKGKQAFYDHRHQVIFSTLRAMHNSGQPIDLITAQAWLKEAGQLEQVGGFLYLDELQESVVSPANLPAYLEIVREHFDRRRLAQSCQATLARVYDPAASFVDLKSTVQADFAEVFNGNSTGLGDRLTARIYSSQVKLIEPETRFRLGNVPICTPGNLTTLSAQAKAGKSASVGAMIASTFATLEADCLGFTSKNPHSFAVIHIDTEQCPYDHQQGIDRATDRAGAQAAPDWLRSYCVTGFSAADVRQSIPILLEDAKLRFGGIHSVFVDGIADASHDVNDPEESGSLITDLHRLAIEFDCPILSIIHLNPNSDFKTRGHLGSQLERKSETNLRLEKDGDGVTVIFADKNRKAPIPKSIAPRFAWNDEAGMHVTIASQRNAKDEAEKQAMQIEAEAVFSAAKNAVISYGQFITFLESQVHVSKSTAKRRFGQMLRTQIIRKELTGFYTLNA